MAAHPAAGRSVLPARAAQWLLPAAVLAQGAGLLMLSPPPPPARVAIAAGAVGVALACAVGWRLRARLSHLDALLVTGAFGGVAMLAAMWVERALAPGGHAAGAHHHHIVAWRASTALMLAVCLPFCVWVCRRSCHGHSRAARWLSHGRVCVGMLGGMLAAGAWAGPALAPALGPAAGAHVAMVAGMVAGTALAVLAPAALRRRSEASAHASAPRGSHHAHGREAA